MREIEFRGQTDNGKWVYGYYVVAERLDNIGMEYFIIETSADGKSHKVIPETIGQYTGLTDKNGKKIYEGDIVQHGFLKYIITWNEKDVSFDFYTANRAAQCGFNAYTTDYFEVIGNIHDTLDLLKDGEE